MGLLDDAIREHLNLKRRRGADPAEIERAEREALGPVRRNRESGSGDDGDLIAGAVLDPALGSALDEPDEGTASDLAEESYGDEESGYAEDDAYLEDDGEYEKDEEFATGDFAAADKPLAEEDDPHRTQVMRTVDIPVPEDATAQHDVEAAFGEEDEVRRTEAEADEGEAGEGEEGEDVLEETPEFLQDTPDHDRLWFEQRPPRDFDFDG